MPSLALQRKNGTNPELRVRATAEGYPQAARGPLGTDGSLHQDSWGHVKPEVGWSEARAQDGGMLAMWGSCHHLLDGGRHSLHQQAQ